MQRDNQPTKPFHLAALEPRHQDLFCALYSDAQVMDFIGAPMSRGAVVAYFQRLLDKLSQADSGVVYRVIEVNSEQDTHRMAGIVRLRKCNKNHEMVMGVMLLPQFQGCDLAYQAQKQLITATQLNNPNQIFTAYCHIKNERAHRLYRRLGFHKVRQLLYYQQPSFQWQRGIL